MSGAQPDLAELLSILESGAAQLRIEIEATAALPTPPTSREEGEAEEALRAERAASANLAALVAEDKRLAAEYESVTDATTPQELRANTERRATLKFDIWEAKVSREKCGIVACQLRRDFLVVQGSSTTPGFRIAKDIADKVAEFNVRLLRWRTVRDPKFSGMGEQIGVHRLALDQLLASPPRR